MNTVQFNLPLAKAGRDRALTVVDAAADDTWKESANGIVRKVARERSLFTTDDVWRELGNPREPRAIGAVMQAAKRDGVCVPTNDWALSERVACHARPVRIWRSLLIS